MSLLEIYNSTPGSIAHFKVEQIVSAAGEGELKDGTNCSEQLRAYFGQVPTEKLALYVEHCLTSAFPKNGLVLQDLINELGRRLDYQVTDGLYQGVKGQVGFDGVWLSPESHSLVIEVKTTDAYRLSLDTLSNYRNKLAEAGKLEPTSSILIVVGREDTGELEAQIRGSRHAWDVRVISAESLIKLVLLKENTEAEETGLKMRSLLTPIEYTRLDRMVDVMFATVTDAEDEVQPEGQASASVSATSGEAEIESETSAKSSSGTWQFTNAKLLQAKREQIVAALGQREGTSLVKKTRALYWSPSHDLRAACAMSKRYVEKNQAPYWYAYHPQWEEFLQQSGNGFFVLGCMDLEAAYAIPHSMIQPLLPLLNTTSSKPGGTYWHIHLIENSDGLAISVPKGEPLPLKQFELPLTAK